MNDQEAINARIYRLSRAFPTQLQLSQMDPSMQRRLRKFPPLSDFKTPAQWSAAVEKAMLRNERILKIKKLNKIKEND